MKVYNYNSLVNLSNSILKHFGVEPFHETIPEIDELLKGHKKVVAVLFDGMGQNIVRMHLKENSFLRSHYVTTINSTFPPTTSAATTSFLTGKYPVETGWLAWMEYIKDYDRNVILFRSVDYNTGEPLIKEGEPHISDVYFPNKRIVNLIKEKGINAFELLRYPIQQDGPKHLLTEGVNKLTNILKKNDECFVYFYWDSPDREMHENGINSWKVKYQVHKSQAFLKKAFKKNLDTLFIFLADHGHVNTKYFDIYQQKDIYALLDKPLTLEKRTPSFFVKEGKQEEFEKLFQQYYGDYFELFTKQEAIDMKLFGEGKPAPGVYDTFGDFVATAKRDYGMIASNELHHPDLFKGHHAGGTDEERLIDISIFKN